MDLRARDCAMKLTWLQTLNTDGKMSNLAYFFICPKLGKDVWLCNIHESDLHNMIQRKTNPFWYDVMLAWTYVNFKLTSDNLCMFIWYNSTIRIENKPFLWSTAYEKD